MKNWKRLLLATIVFLGIARIDAKCCSRPDQGLPGIQGEQGDQGEPGATGPIGPAATATFISLSFDGTFSVDPQETIPFNTPVNALQGDISYDSGTGEVLLVNPGVYSFQYGITGTPSNRQSAMRMNGAFILGGSQLDTAAGIMQGVGFLLEIADPMTTVALINNQPNGSAQPINVTASSVGSQSAYLVIRRIY